MKVYWTVIYGKFRRRGYTFHGRNAKRDAQRLANRTDGRVVREKQLKPTKKLIEN